ncbi:unnamed protein product, partial [Laminaria digitata]
KSVFACFFATWVSIASVYHVVIYKCATSPTFCISILPGTVQYSSRTCYPRVACSGIPGTSIRSMTRFNGNCARGLGGCALPYIYIFFLHPFYYPRLTLPLPPSSNLDPGSHSVHSSPLPTAGTCLRFYREKSAAFSS